MKKKQVREENANSSRREQVISSLRESGLTYAEIGRRLGLSRQRISQISKRATTKKKLAHEAPEALLTTTEVARLLNVHTNTVRRWSNRGILGAYYIGPRGDRRFSRGDINDFLLRKSMARKRKSGRQRGWMSAIS